MAGSSYFTDAAPSIAGYSFGSQIPSYFSNPSFSSSASSSASKPMFDPVTAVLGIGSTVASIFGGQAQANAAQDQAKAARELAEETRIASEKAAIVGARARLAQNRADFGYEYLSKLADTGLFASRERSKALENAGQFANFEAFNPAAMTSRRVDEYNRRLSEAFGKTPGYVPTAGLFV